jgi:hypothetical protein
MIYRRNFRTLYALRGSLGVRFLWIDSLCIVQDDAGDWAAESGRMAEVYASAYCTIALSPAEKARGNFEEDVEKGDLSRRGWIFQERVLSRRILHFTGDETYWECGSAIRSKSAGEIVRPGDRAGAPEPSRLLRGAPEVGFAMFRDLFVRYSRLELTERSDRPVAISGLEYRLEDLHRTRSLYGIVRRYLGESLLWQRSQDKWMEPLFDFRDKVSFWCIKGQRVPSWSWMAYTGEIGYISIPTDGLRWKTDTKFWVTGKKDLGSGSQMKGPYRFVLMAPLGRISSGCRLEPVGRDCLIRDGQYVVG